MWVTVDGQRSGGWKVRGHAEETEMLLNERLQFQFWFRFRCLQPPGVCFSVVFNQDFIGVEATCLCVYLGCLGGGEGGGDVGLFIHESPCQPESA